MSTLQGTVDEYVVKMIETTGKKMTVALNGKTREACGRVWHIADDHIFLEDGHTAYRDTSYWRFGVEMNGTDLEVVQVMDSDTLTDLIEEGVAL